MIKTTHVGSLPRPAAMISRQLKKETITETDLQGYVTDVVERQCALGLDIVNNGELPRDDYIAATIGRIGGFDGTGVAPLPQDLEELPDYARRFSGRNGLITLNPKAPIQLPACSSELRYTGESTLLAELRMMETALAAVPPAAREETELFFTAPSPGTVALFMENHFYPDDQAYLEALGEVLRIEYEAIVSRGVYLQIDCPDLAMGRHTRYKALSERQFLDRAERNVAVLNRSLANIDAGRCRAHVCWGNYPGTHHCDIGLGSIIDVVAALKPTFISLESCNHRHAHEWELFKEAPFPEDKVLMPGVIDTTSNTVEHPDLVASRLRNFINLLGSERVIGATDCGFASTAAAAGVSGEVAWLKLKSLVEGAKRASQPG